MASYTQAIFWMVGLRVRNEQAIQPSALVLSDRNLRIHPLGGVSLVRRILRESQVRTKNGQKIQNVNVDFSYRELFVPLRLGCEDGPPQSG